jgi:hypothetical protein
MQTLGQAQIQNNGASDSKVTKKDQANNSVGLNQLPTNFNYKVYYVIDENGNDEDGICSFLINRRKDYIGDLVSNNIRAQIKQIINSKQFKTNIIELGNWEHTKFEYLYYYTNFYNAVQILMDRIIRCYMPKTDVYGYGVFLSMHHPDTKHQRKLKRYLKMFGHVNEYNKSKRFDCAFAILKKDLCLLNNLIHSPRDTHVLLHMSEIDLNEVTFKFIVKDKRYRYILDVFS